MILSAGFIGSSSSIAAGFVEFTTVGTNQTITSGMIPAGITRVRVHLIGGGGGYANSSSGGVSAFSAGGVSVIASGGYAVSTPYYSPQSGGAGGGVNGVAGVVGSATGGSGGTFTVDGGQGSIGIDVGIAMGGGGGGGGFQGSCGCGVFTDYNGGGGQVGLNPKTTFDPTVCPSQGGAGGGYGSGQSLPIYGSLGGFGSAGRGLGEGIGAGGGGAYAMFYVNINGAQQYLNAITIGNKGSIDAQSGYCRIQWGAGI